MCIICTGLTNKAVFLITIQTVPDSFESPFLPQLECV